MDALSFISSRSNLRQHLGDGQLIVGLPYFILLQQNAYRFAGAECKTYFTTNNVSLKQQIICISEYKYWQI